MSITIKTRYRIENSYTYKETIILSISDLVDYINEYKKPKHLFKGVPSALMNETYRLISNGAKFTSKNFMRHISTFLYDSRFPINVEYWYNRGYTKNEAIKLVSNEQSLNSKKFVDKRKNNPELYDGILPNQIKYWINKGYSKESAIKKVRAHQATFSKEKCISKYGQSEGIKIFEDRQNKWKKSLSKSKGITWTNSDKSNSFSKLEERYGSKWLSYHIKSLSKKATSEVNHKTIKSLNIISAFNNIDEIESYIYNLSFSCLLENITGPLCYILNMSHIEIKSEWCKRNNVVNIKSIYGNIFYDNGKYYKSDKEYIIGKLLDSLKIDFKVNVKYPNTSRITDFYLPKYDLYIEYMGMTNDSYEEKKKELDLLELNILWSDDISEIKNQILKL